MEGDLTHITTEKLDLTATFKEYRDYTTKKLDERELAFKAELRSTQGQLYTMRDELERT
jgi:chromosome segregation ATPase